MKGTWQTTGSGNGATLVIAAFIIAAIVTGGAASAIASAVTAIVAIAAVLVLLALAGIVVYAVAVTRSDKRAYQRIHDGQPPAADAPWRPYDLPQREPKPLAPAQVHQHLHLHGMSPAEVAQILAAQRGHHDPEDRCP